MINATPLAAAFIPPVTGGAPPTPMAGSSGSSGSSGSAEAADFGRELQGAMDAEPAVLPVRAERGARVETVPSRPAAVRGAPPEVAAQAPGAPGAPEAEAEPPVGAEAPADTELDEVVDLSELGFVHPEGTAQTLPATGVMPSATVTQALPRSPRLDGVTPSATPPMTVGASPAGREALASDADHATPATTRPGLPDASPDYGHRFRAASAGKMPQATERATDPRDEAAGGAEASADVASSLSSAGAVPSPSGAARPAESASATGTAPLATTAGPLAGPASAAPAAHRSDPSLPVPMADAAVATPVDHPAFVPAFSARIATLVRDGVEQARVRLNPLDMGPVAVQLALDGTQVRVDLAAEVAATRQLLEQSLPSLAGALREAGFTLSGGGVFQQSRQGFGAEGSEPAHGRRSGDGPGDTAPGTEAMSATIARQPARGLVDVFA